MSVFSAYFTDLFSKFSRTDAIIGLVLIAALTVWEFIGVGHKHDLTITEWIKSWMPMALRIMIWSWLGWHFILSDIVKQLTPKA